MDRRLELIVDPCNAIDACKRLRDRYYLILRCSNVDNLGWQIFMVQIGRIRSEIAGFQNFLANPLELNLLINFKDQSSHGASKSSI